VRHGIVQEKEYIIAAIGCQYFRCTAFIGQLTLAFRFDSKGCGCYNPLVISLPYWRKVMKFRLFSVVICVLLFIVMLMCLPGCEGAGKMDRQVREQMDAKLKDWNQNGFPIVDPSAVAQTKGNLKEWRFKYAKLFLVFDSQKAQPVVARMVLERIATGWYETYPANIKPRFILEVRAFHDIESHDNEWGMCKVKRDGSPETHWYPTDVY